MAHDALDASQNNITHGGAKADKALFLNLIEGKKKRLGISVFFRKYFSHICLGSQ